MLRPYQERAIDALRASYRAGHRAPCLVLPTGGGKCLGIGTPVLRFDGMIVPVEDVREGDILMGPDSTPRRVLGTTRGHSPLFRIVPVKGDPWVCNDVHVLTLVHTETGNTIDVDLPTYLAESKWFRHMHKQFTPASGVDFAPDEMLPLDPYFVGVWFGDGSKALGGVAITKPDPEILDICERMAAQFGIRVRTDVKPTGCPTHYIARAHCGGRTNPLLDLLRSIAGAGTHIPHQYLTASRVDRLQLLAGLLDTDGYMNHAGFEIVQKQRGFSEGICFLARSLGLRALMAEKVVNGASYWRVTINGDCSVIPNRIPRKRAPARLQIKCATRTGFTVEPIGDGEYAGFEVDGDGRFLLGDFTVTHNTVVAASIIRATVDRGGRVLFLAHRSELLHQTVAKLEQAGVHDVRLIRAATTLGPATARVTVGSVQTLTGRLDQLPPATLIVCDEAHHFVAETFARILAQYPAALVLGLTATPERGDGAALGDIFDDLVIGATVTELTDLGHLAPCTVWGPPMALESSEVVMSPADAYARRGGDQRAVVFCSTAEHCRTVVAEFEARGIAAAVVSGDQRAADRAATLAAFRAGDVRVVACVHVLTEGWDDPAVGVCILARKLGHAGTYLQAVGRVLRPAPGKTRAQVIDLCGSSLAHGTPAADRTYSLEGKAISASDRLAIKQCPECGAVYEPSGEPGCPTCGCVPAVPAAKHLRVVGGELVEVTHVPAPSFEIRITSKFAGRCSRCEQAFAPGAPIYWLKGRKQQRHQQCVARAA